MGNSCAGPAGGNADSDEILTAKDTPGVGVPILSIPGAEVVVISGNGKDGAVTERGTFGLFQLKPGDKSDCPGQYVMTRPAMLARDLKLESEDICRVEAGTAFTVVEVVRRAADKRIRARVDDPPGWFSIENTQTKARWAEKLAPGVLFVGESFGSSADKGGFYYPLTPASPVILIYESKSLTFSAGEGDCFSIRLPKDLDEDKLQELIQALPDFCNFTMQKKKDVEDYVKDVGGGVTGAIGWAANWGVKAIQKSGETTRAKTKQEEEVQIGAGTKVALGAAKATTGATVAVGGKVVDGLLTTAVFLGKQAGKQIAPENTAAPSKKGPSAGGAALASGLQVFDALIKASDLLAKTSADETAAVVGHKYGKDAGQAARDGISVGGDILALQDMVGKKAVGKLAAKGAMYTVGGVVEGAVAGAPPKGGS